MASVPKVPSCRFKGRKFKPVCGISMDLKAFLSDDTKLKEVATNLLCLPGRLTWCPPTNQHAFAVAPLFTYNSSRKTMSKENDAFKGLYGQDFHLFYTSHDLYYYGGFYKALDLRSETPHGISLAGSDLSWKSIAAATLRDDLDSSSPQTSRLLATLYQEGVLKVQILGLQCLGFNADIYNMLTAHYDTFRSVMKPTGKLGGYFPDSEAMRDESEGPKKKKQKISAKF
ncbi:hypothetical protein BDN70DRAFT_881980 [Pholiota conissans]|uniref:Uncharacterized protein n=1 Tax=Pholiota conissans TaxID=109636 RepID=A0A9P5YYB9_9AGAR|nr:hypothetical protein BDN70DRAFT_881980 [Pholiota conissans]